MTEEENRLRRPPLAWIPVLVLAAVLIKLTMAVWGISLSCANNDVASYDTFFELINLSPGSDHKLFFGSDGVFCSVLLILFTLPFFVFLPYLFAWTIWALIYGRKRTLIASSALSLLTLLLFLWQLILGDRGDRPTVVGSAVVAAALILAFLLHRHPFYDRPASKTISRLSAQKISFLLLFSLPTILGVFVLPTAAIRISALLSVLYRPEVYYDDAKYYGWNDAVKEEEKESSGLGSFNEPIEYPIPYDPYNSISPWLQYFSVLIVPVLWQIIVFLSFFDRNKILKFTIALFIVGTVFYTAVLGFFFHPFTTVNAIW